MFTDLDIVRDDDLTPVEFLDGLYLKRDDYYSIAGVSGGKARACYFLAKCAAGGLVSASSRFSPQIIIVSYIAKYLGLPCCIYTPAGADTAEIELASSTGADIRRVSQGYNNLLIFKARMFALKNNWKEIPFGMRCLEAVHQTAFQVKNIRFCNINRIVIPVGSGISLAGLLHGLRFWGLDIPVLGVFVGANPVKNLDSFAPFGWRRMVSLVSSGLDYHSGMDAKYAGVILDPFYEGKCLSFLQDGDLFWIVGLRNTIIMENLVEEKKI